MEPTPGHRQQLRVDHAADREQPRLLFARGEPGRAAGAHVDVFSVVMANHVGLGRSLGNADDRHPALVVDLNLLVERENHRMHLAAEHRVYHPAFEIASSNARDRPVVFHSQQDSATLKIGQGHDLLRELFRAHVIALELHSGVLAMTDQFEQIRSGHRRSTPYVPFRCVK